MILISFNNQSAKKRDKIYMGKAPIIEITHTNLSPLDNTFLFLPANLFSSLSICANTTYSSGVCSYCFLFFTYLICKLNWHVKYQAHDHRCSYATSVTWNAHYLISRGLNALYSIWLSVRLSFFVLWSSASNIIQQHPVAEEVNMDWIVEATTKILSPVIDVYHSINRLFLVHGKHAS